MSSDPGTAARPEQPEAGTVPDRRSAFRRRFIGTVVVLTVLVASFAVVSVVQGPRLRGAVLDATSLTRLAGQRLVLEVDRPVSAFDASGVTVSPAAAVSAAADDRSDGRAITLTFAEPLAAATDYTVRVPGVVGESSGAASTLEYRFSTRDEAVYTLVRRSDPNEPDFVQRKSFRSPQSEQVLSAPFIQEFVHVDEAVAAITLDETAATSLVVAGIKQSEAPPQPIALVPGTISDLRGSVTGSQIGFVLTSPEADGTRTHTRSLFTMDLAGGGGAAQPLVAPTGQPFVVSDWAFVPGSPAVVVQDADGSLFLVELTGEGTSTPLGVHQELRGFVPGTTRLVVADPDRGSLIDLADGTTTTLDLRFPELDDRDYPGLVTMLADAMYLMAVINVAVFDDRNEVRHRILRVDDEADAEVFTPIAADGVIREYCVSPDGRYAAVAVSPAGSRPDGYPAAAGWAETTTTVVDVRTGRTQLSQSGGTSDWCRI